MMMMMMMMMMMITVMIINDDHAASIECKTHVNRLNVRALRITEQKQNGSNIAIHTYIGCVKQPEQEVSGDKGTSYNAKACIKCIRTSYKAGNFCGTKFSQIGPKMKIRS